MATTELLRDGRWRFEQADDDVYRAPLSAPAGMGLRFFCPVWQWGWRQENGVYPFEQRTLSTSTSS